MEEYRLIPLVGKRGEGKFAKVSPEDYERVASLPWKLSPYGYAIHIRQENGKRIAILMHRFILDAKEGEEVDHRHHDTLDNQRSELRKATRLQNCQNTRSFRGESSYKGVRRAGSGWHMRIGSPSGEISVGAFERETDAARAYDMAALHLFGEFANPNFKDSQPAPLEEIRRWCKSLKGQSSRFRGVTKSFGRWAAEIKVDSKKVRLGRYDSEEEAARAYDDAAKKYRGDKAIANF